jgi:hypothetical protein
MITEEQPGSCDLIAPFVDIQVHDAVGGTPKLFRGVPRGWDRPRLIFVLSGYTRSTRAARGLLPRLGAARRGHGNPGNLRVRAAGCRFGYQTGYYKLFDKR